MFDSVQGCSGLPCEEVKLNNSTLDLANMASVKLVGHSIPSSHGAGSHVHRV